MSCMRRGVCHYCFAGIARSIPFREQTERLRATGANIFENHDNRVAKDATVDKDGVTRMGEWVGMGGQLRRRCTAER